GKEVHGIDLAGKLVGLIDAEAIRLGLQEAREIGRRVCAGSLPSAQGTRRSGGTGWLIGEPRSRRLAKSRFRARCRDFHHRANRRLAWAIRATEIATIA